MSLVSFVIYTRNRSSDSLFQNVPRITPEILTLAEEIRVVRGSAVLEHQGEKLLVYATSSAIPLQEGDKVHTEINSLATLFYSRDTRVTLGPETDVIFHSASASASRLEEIVGSVYVRFKRIFGVQEEFSVETPTTVAVVRGTAFGSFVRKNKSVRTVVTRDRVFVEKKRGKNEATASAEVDSGHFVEVLPRDTRLSVSSGSADAEEGAFIELNISLDSLFDNKEDRDDPLCTTCSAKRIEESTESASASGRFIQFLDAQKKAREIPTPVPLPRVQSFPGEGLHRGIVQTDAGSFPLTCIGARIGSFRVVTDAANDSDCKNDCPVMRLDEYARRNNGFAAMNGMYFCPADYPACSGKKNSFDTLLFHSRNKKYLNSDNNVYSVLPFLAIDGGGHPIYKSRTLDWGRDTGIQAGIAGNPLLVSGGNIVFDENSLDQKQRTIKSNRGAVATAQGILSLCVVGGATVGDSARVYKAIGTEYAMNIDGGGSTALWANGSYIFGPGRALPNAIIFSR